LCQFAAKNGSNSIYIVIRLQILESKAYKGTQDAKKYFLIVNIMDEVRKVSTATMHLTGDAKVWWRTKYIDIQAQHVRKALRELRHTGSILDYVKAFATHMLDIRDMSEKDKLFTFLDGLKHLRDKPTTTNTNQPKVGGRMEMEERDGGDGGEMRRDATYSRRREATSPPREFLRELQQRKVQENHQVKLPRCGGCFLCDEPHRIKDSIAPMYKKKGMMYVDIKINGKLVLTMINTGATHNYLASAKMERLRLVLEKGVGWVKAINSPTQPITGVAKSMLIKVRPFERRTNLSMVMMDDFKFILGLEFLRNTRTAVLPHMNSMIIMENIPCIILMLAKKLGEENLSAIQFKKG
ncbi:hypothetical protein Pfo_001677, partial [Paulownia fortunei]